MTASRSYRYDCYGLIVSSEIELPDLGPETAATSPADLHIRRGDLSGPPPGATALPARLWRDGTTCGFDVDDVGRYEIREGNEIIVDAAPGARERDLRLFLLGSSIGAAMMQRGNLVLHGNAIRIGDACAVVVGHSGSGKSTLAAEFDRRGYDVLSDDVVPVDAAGRALPGYPRIKLWHDALDRLGRSTEGLARVRDEHPKFEVPLRRGAVEPLPLRWIYVLERHTGPDLRIEPASGAETFALLHEHTYRNELITGPDATATHLGQCADLMNRARMRRVLRPAATMSAEATATAILDDLEVPAARPNDQPGSAPDRPAVPPQECA